MTEASGAHLILGSFPLITFGKVVCCPQGLKVAVVKALTLLLKISQIKRCAGANVVNVPFAVIVPIHAWLKLSRQMSKQMVDRTTKQIKCLS